MEKLESNTTIDNDKISFRGQTELDCLACSSVIQETWETHIKKSSHIVAHKQFDLIFDIVDNIVRCKFCNVELSREICKEHKKIHYVIPWDKIEGEYDKYEIFFENFILEWKGSFHCYLCDVTYLEWSTALVHITNAKHQSLISDSTRKFDNSAEITENNLSYKLLVTEGLLAQNVSSVKCMFCNSQSVSIKSVLRHVQGLAHISSRSKFVLRANVETHTVTSDSQDNGEYRTQEWVNREYNEEIKNSSLNNGEAAKKFSTPIQSDNFRAFSGRNPTNINCCKIDGTKEDNHKTNEARTIASHHNGRDSMSPINMNELYSPLSDCEKSNMNKNYENFIEPIDTSASEESCEDTIMESRGFEDIDGDCGDLEEIWIIPINDKYSHCIICNLSFSSSPTHKSIHLAGKFHMNSRKLNGCDRIKIDRVGRYYCQCCKEELKNRGDVQLHVRKSSHLNSSSQSHQRLITVPPSIKHIPQSGREIFPETPKHLPSCYIVKVTANNFHCVICDLDVSFSSINVNEHIESELHAASLHRYGCRSILRTSYTGYYCGHCHLNISSCERLYNHIKGDAHLNSLKKADPKKPPQRMATCRNRPISTEKLTLRRPRTGTTKANELPQSPDKANSNRLKEEKSASEDTEKFRKDFIVELSDSSFNKPVSKEKLTLQRPLKGILKADKLPQSPDKANSNRLKEEIPVSKDTEKFRKDFIVELSDTSFRCMLCDCQLLPTFGNFDEHVGQIAHREAMNIYGCDQISFEKDDIYHCKCCNVDFKDFGAVCLHVRDRNHVKSLSVSISSKNNNIKTQQDDWSEKRDYYVTVGNDLTAFCEICQCKLSSSIRNISYHTMGKHHTKSLLKYGCEYIIQAEDRSYYCKCCDAHIDNLESVFRHIKTSNHSNFMRAAVSQSSDAHIPPMKPKLKEEIDTSSTRKTEVSHSKNFAQRRLEDIKNDNARNAQKMTAVEEFNSNDIVLLGENKYYCNYCSCMISGFEGMSLHSKGKKHLTTRSLHLLKDSLRDGNTQ